MQETSGLCVAFAVHTIVTRKETKTRMNEDWRTRAAGGKVYSLWAAVRERQRRLEVFWAEASPLPPFVARQNIDVHKVLRMFTSMMETSANDTTSMWRCEPHVFPYTLCTRQCRMAQRHNCETGDVAHIMYVDRFTCPLHRHAWRVRGRARRLNKNCTFPPCSGLFSCQRPSFLGISEGSNASTIRLIPDINN